MFMYERKKETRARRYIDYGPGVTVINSVAFLPSIN